MITRMIFFQQIHDNSLRGFLFFRCCSSTGKMQQDYFDSPAAHPLQLFVPTCPCPLISPRPYTLALISSHTRGVASSNSLFALLLRAPCSPDIFVSKVEGRFGVAKLAASLSTLPPTALRVVVVGVGEGEGLEAELGGLLESPLWTDSPERTIVFAPPVASQEVCTVHARRRNSALILGLQP